ncbi:MAG: error-prone DNA polymerase, partial [Burkholderiales bacterium]
IIAYPANRDGWGDLCRILTKGNLRPHEGAARATKGECLLTLDDLLARTANLLLVVMPGEALDGLGDLLAKIKPKATAWLGAAMHRRGDDIRRLAKLKRIAAQAGLSLIATNDVLYHEPEQRDLQDMMTCIREGVKITEAGRLLESNSERHLKDRQEMARLFRQAPDAIEQTQVLLDLVEFDLGQLQYQYPPEPVPPGWNDQEYLENRVWFYAGVKYNWRIPKKVKRLLRKELKFICKRDMAQYFLTIFDTVRVAENLGILCQGRGSAANSAVCFALGITSVNPATFDVLFERFLSVDRGHEPPDIDVDFEHERREEIIQHIYKRYGRDRAGIAATVIHYRPRSAMREIGKVMGLTDDVTARLSGLVWGSWGEGLKEKQLEQAGLDPHNPVLHGALDFARRLVGYPRHLSQHVGGFVLTSGRLDELVLRKLCHRG